MSEWDNNIYFTMIPAVSEINEYDGDDLYYCGLAETHQSIRAMVNAAHKEFFAGKDPSDPNWASPRFGSIHDRESKGVHGAFPEVLFYLAISLTSSGMGAGVYKLIDSWVKAKNGRKIHVKLPNGLVVDATQMSHVEFSEFLSKIYEVYCRDGDHKVLTQHVDSKRIKKVDSEEERKLKLQLGKAVDEKKQLIAKKRGLE